MKTEHIIIWQKWLDPFGEDTEVVQQEATEDFENSWSEYEEDSGPDQLLSEENKISYNKIKMTKVIATPMGIIPIDENTASGKIFNFWVGHTNFNITKLISSVIERTPGVECLDIFTRYRFRIAIGKAFNGSDVMKDIQDAVYAHISENKKS